MPLEKLLSYFTRSSASSDSSSRSFARPSRDVVTVVLSYTTVDVQRQSRLVSKSLYQRVKECSTELLLRRTIHAYNLGSEWSGGSAVALDPDVPVEGFSSVDALLAWAGGEKQVGLELLDRFPAARCFVLPTVWQLMLADTGLVRVRDGLRVLEHESGSYVRTVFVWARSTLRNERGDDSRVPFAKLSIVYPLKDWLPPTAKHATLRIVSICHIAALRSIEPRAFESCENLEALSLDALPDLCEIGERAFTKCLKLVRFLIANLPRLTQIGGRSFELCHSLPSLDLSNGLPCLECIGSTAFSECKSLARLNLANLPALKAVGFGAFRECRSLTALDLSDHPVLETIGDWAFGPCPQLKVLKLNRLPSLTFIGFGAFNACAELEFAEFSDLPALSHIGKCSFAQCNLQVIPFHSLPQLRHVAQAAFRGAKRLQRLQLDGTPAQLETIADSAFADSSLATVALSNLPSLGIIGDETFMSCSALRSVALCHLPKLRCIPRSLLSNCAALSSVELADLPSLTTIQDGAFCRCTALKSINLSSLASLVTIEERAFQGVLLADGLLSHRSAGLSTDHAPRVQ